MRRRRLLSTGVVVALAGCVAVPADEDETDEQTGEKYITDAIETRIALTDLQARRRVTVETPDETTTQVEEIYRKPPAEKRRAVRRSDDDDPAAGTVSVTNREITWDYYPEENLVMKRHHPNRVVADGPRLALESLRENYDLSYDGLDTVDDRDVHRIEASPIDPAGDDAGRSIDLLVGETVYRIPLETVSESELDEATVSRTVWIDDERRYPIKERDDVRSGDGELLHRLTVTYEGLEIDAGLDPETFVYEPPEDAEVVTIGLEPSGIYDSLEAAAADAPYDLPDPDVPAPYELDRVTLVEKERQSGPTTMLWYLDPERPERELYVAVRTDPRFNPDALEETAVNGHTAYRREGRIDSLFWTCSALSYEVSSATGEESLTEVASSVGCP
ncbi:hypothetical protein C483_15731 [Natrialba hulunbeirensis JCM 10989]|uniref:Outer membrane lipoprotein carrier protein LolA n=1 Tax=Natrialba hulunbeirensis JCM 10989 TaxID=1227493 RepID=L9ZP98_9EURY|nr:hypothetical protein [Natrialba hulunbeirensis]ELY88179.1 hypothetical protein C483_15731 [Natrialba hulunbeirensis JCM 10989]